MIAEFLVFTGMLLLYTCFIKINSLFVLSYTMAKVPYVIKIYFRHLHVHPLELQQLKLLNFHSRKNTELLQCCHTRVDGQNLNLIVSDNIRLSLDLKYLTLG